MAEDFGERYTVDTDRSMFEVPMGTVPPELKFPETYITLSDLTDEQIEEALEECRAAGVAEEDLMDCVYDKGYVGLAPDLPAVYDNTYAVTPEVKEPAKTDGQLEKPSKNNNLPIVFPPRRIPPIIRSTPPPPRTTAPRGGTPTIPTPSPR